jgi:hypothetical protein
VLIFAALALAACGTPGEVAPRLVALPTRTPAPITPTPAEVAAAAPSNIEVISLHGAIDAFLTASEAASPLERIDLFIQHVLTPHPACFEGSLWLGAQPLETLDNLGLNLPSVDMENWRASVDAFPETQALAAAEDALREAYALLPRDTVLRVCVAPVPGPRRPFEEAPDGGLNIQVMGSDLVLALCSAGESCLEPLRSRIAGGYGYAYQIEQVGLTGAEIPLLGWAVYQGRADDLALRLFPDASFPWTDALTPEQEATVWEAMQEYLQTTYSDYPGYRNVDRFLYGYGGQERFPPWGGIYIGEQIVAAYRASHPDVTPAELMALDLETLLAGSGYAPG